MHGEARRIDVIAARRPTSTASVLALASPGGSVAIGKLHFFGDLESTLSAPPRTEDFMFEGSYALNPYTLRDRIYRGLPVREYSLKAGSA